MTLRTIIIKGIIGLKASSLGRPILSNAKLSFENQGY